MLQDHVQVVSDLYPEHVLPLGTDRWNNCRAPHVEQYDGTRGSCPKRPVVMFALPEHMAAQLC